MSASAPRRLLILAEGFSGDPHYGKTMRGVLRYRGEDVVAILDSTRAGESEQGVPIVADVAAALALAPDGGARRRRDPGRPVPAGLAGAAARLHPARDRRSRTACTSSSRTTPSSSSSRATFGVTLTDLRRPPAGLDVPTGANLEVPGKIVLTVGSDCAIGKMTVSLELDREAQRPRDRVRVRPDRADRDRDRGLGHLGRRRRRGLHRRRRGAARRRGQRARGRPPARRGAGLDLAPGLLGRHARPHPRLGAARVRALPHGRRDRGRGLSRLSAAVAAGARGAARARSRSRGAAPPSPASRSTRGTSTTTRRARRSRAAEAETGLVADDPVRFGAARLLDAVLAQSSRSGMNG